MDPQLQTFRDFLLTYNQLSINCFRNCIDNMNSRLPDDDEVQCVDRCVDKYMRYSHRVMATYVREQPAIIDRRTREAERQFQQAQAHSQALEDEKNALMDAPASPDGNSQS